MGELQSNLITVAIFFLGHGGNLAVADHASADISRLNGTKCPAPVVLLLPRH